jgi:hypothetical protein
MTARRLAFTAVVFIFALAQGTPAAAQTTGPDAAMLPSEAQAGLSFLEAPATNLSDTGEVISVTATYKAPPAAGAPTDPLDVCEGAGFGGADAGFGPNLCIEVQLSQHSEPCPDCFDLPNVRERFPLYAGTTSEQPAPETCATLNADPTGPVAWPCVGDSSVFDRGAEIRGFENVDRNVHMTRFVLIGEVDGIVISMETRYLTYAVDPVELDYMSDQVRDLGAVVAAQIRQHLAGGSNTTNSGGGTVTGPLLTTNDQAVDHVAPIAVIGGLAAIAAVAATIGASSGATGAAVDVSTGGVNAGTSVPTSSPPPSSSGHLVDPDTGQALPVDGKLVWIGEWMPHEEAQQIIDARLDEKRLDDAAAAHFSQFVATQQSIRDDQMVDGGYTFDADSNTWKPSEGTQAVLDAQWQDKINQDPSWVKTQQQFDTIQAAINDAKKSMLASHNTSLQKEHDINNAYAHLYDSMYVGAKLVQGATDTAINILETVTGPAGGVIKKTYTFTKTFAGDLSEKGVSTQSVFTAAVKGMSDVGMDELGGKILPAYDFGNAPDLSNYDVTYIAKQLFAKGSLSRYYMVRHFAPGTMSTIQGEAQNYAGWRPIGDDAKTALGALTGDGDDAKTLMTKPVFLNLVVEKLAIQPNMIGGPL